MPASKRACSPLARVLAILSRMSGPTAVVTRIGGDDTGDHLVTGGTHRRHVAHHVQLLIRPYYMDLVLLTVVELVDQGVVDVGEGDLMAGIRQHFADKAATDVTSTKMQCFHDINLLNQRR